MAKTKGDGPSGLVVIDKPEGITSHDVVSKLRWIAGTRRVGHAGTLDPAATGVLILGLNKATKLLTYLVGQDKTYQATIQLGISTETDDAQGRQTGTCPEAVEALTEQRILEAVASLTGDIMQVPSAVSAIKVNGVRSYTRVRSGEQVELAARPVRVNEFTVHSIQRTMTSWCVLVSQQELAEAGIDAAGTHGELSDPTTAITSVPVINCEVTVSCSSGTYIRALARDLGQMLGTGGHLIRLRRTRVGETTLADAAALPELLERRQTAGQPLTDMPLLSLEEAARRLFKVRELSAQQATDVSFGRRISPNGDGTVTPRQAHTSTGDGGEKQHATTEGVYAAFAPDGTLVALLENLKQRGSVVATPTLVFEAGTDFSRAWEKSS